MADSAILESQRQGAYFGLRAARDVRDAEAESWGDSVSRVSGAITSALSRSVVSISQRKLDQWLRISPALGAYRFALLDIRRSAPRVPEHDAELVQGLTPEIIGWQSPLYQQLIDRTDFGTVRSGSRTLDVWHDRTAIASDSNRSVRRDGYQKLYAGFARQRNLYAFLLLRTVESRNRLASSLGEVSAPEQVYRSRYLELPRVRALLHDVRGRAGLYRRYIQSRVDFARQQGGFDDAGPWDLTGGSRFTPPRFSPDSARIIMRVALAPLGTAYAAELDSLLDPRAERLDLTGGEHRASGGSSVGFPGTPTGVYLFGFEGYYTDLSRLVHESAHAMHTRMMTRGRVPPAESSGANYLAEAMALLNELVVADFLQSQATDPALRQFYLERFLDKGFELVHGAQDADLEQAIYDSAATGRLATADGLDSLSTRVMAPYSIWDPATAERRERWIYARLLYNDPLYLVNYLYSGAIALSLFEQFRRDPQRFSSRYVRFLKRGYSAPPEELLRQLGVDLADSGLIAADLGLLSSRMAELERLQAENLQ
jgi:oligoendopeptidase F